MASGWQLKRTPGNAPGVLIDPEGKEWMVYGAVQLLAKIRTLEGLAPYAVHFSNCTYESWGLEGATCECGLFALLKAVGYKSGEA